MYVQFTSCVYWDYIHSSDDHGYGLFYLVTWMIWRRSSSSWRCCNPSIVLESAVSWVFYWLGVVYRWLLRLGHGPKLFSSVIPPHSLRVVQSIVYHCILRRCSSHMVHDLCIGWWRILMTMVHTSLVYILPFRNLRRWQKVNIVSILLL